MTRSKVSKAAQVMAEKGSSAGGRARAEKLSPLRRQQIAKAAAAARWAKVFVFRFKSREAAERDAAALSGRDHACEVRPVRGDGRYLFELWSTPAGRAAWGRTAKGES